MSSPLLHEALITYRRAMAAANVPEGTRKQYAMVIRRLEIKFPGRHFAGIRVEDLSDLLYGEDGILVGKAPGTGTTYRSALRSFFAFGQARGWTRTVTEVPTPPFRQRQRKPFYAPTRLTEPELVDMLDRAEHSIMRGMVAVAIGTALRISDIRKIRLTDVDMVTGELYVWVQKTGRFDAMPITLDLEEELRRYLLWYTSETGVKAGTPGAFLFPGWGRGNLPGSGHMYYLPDPWKQCSYAWPTERLHHLFAECGIAVEPREAWHVIRRSVARIYFDRLRSDVAHDHALRQTAAFLGHKNQETTERYLGIQAEVEARNASLRGQRFLPRSVEGVTRLGGQGRHPRGAGTLPDDQAL